MASAGGSTTKYMKSYPMTKLRLGLAIIIDNVCTPGSEADLTELKDAYDTAGFEVYLYRRCDTKKFKSIKSWFCAEESHEFCNTFSLTMMCPVSAEGDLLDHNEEELTSINDLVEDIVGISTLNEKAKVITIQAYPEKKTDGICCEELPELPQRDDVFIAYSQITGHKDSGSEYVQTFAKFLKAEYMEKSVQNIYRRVDDLMKQKASLPDSMLMKLAKCVAARDMEVIALTDFGIEQPTITNLADEPGKSREKLNFEIMALWRNEAANPTKEKLIEIMLKSSRVNPVHVKETLQADSEESHLKIIENNGLIQELHLSEFHVPRTKKIAQLEEKVKQLEEKNVNFESEMKRLKAEKEAGTEKLKQLEIDKEKYEKEIAEMKEQREREKTVMKEAEVETLRNLEEQARLSAQRLERLKGGQSDIDSKQLVENLSRVKQEAELVASEAKVIQYEKELHILNEALMETKDEETKRKAELEKLMIKMTQYEEDIHNLNKQLNEAKENETKRKDELEKQMAQLQENKDLNTTEMEKMKETITKQEEEINKLKETHSNTPELASKLIELEHKTTYETGLCGSGYTKFCVMESTGYIIFVGKEKEDDPAALHIYKYKDGWQKIETKSGPCSHIELHLLPLMIENNEYLLVSCAQCKTIWFCNLHTGNFSKAIKEEGFGPGMMCKAEGNYIYIVNRETGLSKPILKAKCTPTELSLDKSKTIRSRMGGIYDIYYLPDVKCIAVSSWPDHVVKAIHCETDEQIWEVKGEVAGVTWEPEGLCYSPEHQSLLVCDTSGDRRLVVVNPRDGSLLQKIPLYIIGFPLSLYLHEGIIIMHNRASTGDKINVFSIN